MDHLEILTITLLKLNYILDLSPPNRNGQNGLTASSTTLLIFNNLLNFFRKSHKVLTKFKKMYKISRVKTKFR